MNTTEFIQMVVGPPINHYPSTFCLPANAAQATTIADMAINLLREQLGPCITPVFPLTRDSKTGEWTLSLRIKTG